MIKVKCISTTQTFAFEFYILATLTIKHVHEDLLRTFAQTFARRLDVPTLTVVCHSQLLTFA